jgi:hypothetical protein
MMQAHAIAEEKPFAYSKDPFKYSEQQFHSLKARLQSTETQTMRHSDLEQLIEAEGRELMRRLLQDHLRLRAQYEQDRGLTGPVVGADGEERTHRRTETERRLMTIFGPVEVDRIQYGGRGINSLHPIDAELNLPTESYSHGVRRRVAEEVARGSFDNAVATMASTTGAPVPKRQVEELTIRAAADFDEFYEARAEEGRLDATKTAPILVVTTDAKGVVMRKDDLREATRKAAKSEKHKMRKRLSRGEKKNRKRMAMVAAVYTVAGFVRKPEDIVANLYGVEDAKKKQKRPRPEHKRVWASVMKPGNEVIGEAFSEAMLRDPDRTKQWVGLIDGNEPQLDELERLAEEHGVDLEIILDIVHVIEYLWKAAMVFCDEGTPEAEEWVTERLLRILQGESNLVAGGIRRSATRRGLRKKARKNADKCADYLLKYKDYMRYDEYLANGFPIATGVIEGACRHLVNDRLGITGARWGLDGAEAVLRLRSLKSSGHFDNYWRFHEDREYARNHAERYENAAPPRTELKTLNRGGRAHLQIVK